MTRAMQRNALVFYARRPRPGTDDAEDDTDFVIPSNLLGRPFLRFAFQKAYKDLTIKANMTKEPFARLRLTREVDSGTYIAEGLAVGLDSYRAKTGYGSKFLVKISDQKEAVDRMRLISGAYQTMFAAQPRVRGIPKVFGFFCDNKRRRHVMVMEYVGQELEGVVSKDQQ